MYDAHGRQMRKDVSADQFIRPAAISAPSVVDRMTDFSPKVMLPDTASTAAHWEGPKHPVSKFQEYCARGGLDFEFTVSDHKLEQGFMAQVFMFDECIVTAYGPSKKEAKKDAAEQALKIVAHDEAKYPTKAPPVVHGAISKDEGASAVVTAPILPVGEVKETPPDLLQKFAAQCKIVYEIDVSSQPVDTHGFEASVTVNGENISWACGQTKKEALNQGMYCLS